MINYRVNYIQSSNELCYKVNQKEEFEDVEKAIEFIDALNLRNKVNNSYVLEITDIELIEYEVINIDVKRKQIHEFNEKLKRIEEEEIFKVYPGQD